MIELLVIGGLCLVGLFLCFLILIPLMLVGAVIKLVFGLLLLPFRLLGFAVGAGVSVAALLCKGLFGILALLAGLAVLVVGVALFPVGLFLLALVAAAFLIKLVAGVALGAAA